MLLEKLREYTFRPDLNLPPLGYNSTPIRWLIKLDQEGNFLGFITTSSGRKADRGKFFLAPAVMKTSGVRASLLVGNGEYVLGLPRAASKPGRVAQCHKAFVQEVRDCAAATGEAAVQAVLRFLEAGNLAALPLPEDFNPEMNLSFQVEDLLPIDLPGVRRYWAQKQQGGPQPEKDTCLVCGQTCRAEDRHPVKIKGIPGGQPSGMALVSANAPAFESYGLKASHIAPVCLDCAERYAKAVNALREREDSRLVVGPLLYLFWTRQDTGFNVAALFSQPRPEEVKELLRAAAKGRAYTAVDAEAFYTVALAASGGRVVVRDWLETTLGEVKGHLARWFLLQRLVDWDGSEGPPLGLFALSRSLTPARGNFQRDLPPNAPRALLKVALQGGALPYWLLFQALKRNRAEQALNRPRAALIKMVLLSQEKSFQEDAMVRLDEDNLKEAYLLGRLLAVLEQVQMLAVSPKATLIDRFYGTASTAPASVFSRLLKGAQAHLGKLRKERPSAYYALQERLEDILGKLSDFPKVLSLEDQGWFSLGYYHQRAWDRAQARARKEAGEAVLEEELIISEPEEQD
ncbi:MAG: type I-C CRISPR-associated protein Cas8c/Csd1 [Deltaproteobacteria bacterium]|nr:type I-C CRISPR-associated protein Cas8c/Csd1 [Deltaproteobacteria bacterium]